MEAAAGRLEAIEIMCNRIHDGRRIASARLLDTASRWLLLFLGVALLIPSAARAEEPARLSAIVSVLKDTPPLPSWLNSLDSFSYVEAYALFPPQTGEDVIFGIDQEFMDGTQNPAFIKGGDWMGLVGLQRTGAVWVAKGTDATLKGTPSKERTWEIIPLGQPLKPNVWYRLRTIIDFKTRHYVSFTISGPDLDRTLDLHQLTLDYPNYIPFDHRILTSYTFAMRGKSMVKDPKSTAFACFDDVSVGLTGPSGDHQIFFDDFERHSGPIPRQDISLLGALFTGIKVKSYKEGQWYLEQDTSLSRVLGAPFAHSGGKVVTCDATLQTIDYQKWFSAW